MASAKQITTPQPFPATILAAGLLLVITLSLVTIEVSSASPKQTSTPSTKVVLLGTGNPQPDPDRNGASTAIVVNNTAYLVDFGAGVVRQAAAAEINHGIGALNPTRLKIAFLTHLHSDHTVGYPDLILTPWTMGRRVPLQCFGPKGLKKMTDHILAAYSDDINIRTNGMEQIPNDTCQVDVREISPGVVYKDKNVTVTAFRTLHGDWEESLGYRFDTQDRSIVIPGDTAPNQATIDACNGCDVLVHEAQTENFLNNSRRPNPQGFDLKAYAEKYHTSTAQLAELAQQARPKLLILHHNSITLCPDKRPRASTPEDLLREIRTAGYRGKVVVGLDLDVY